MTAATDDRKQPRSDAFLPRTGPWPKCAGRYVDDLFLFGATRAELRAWREQVREDLARELSLRLKHPRARILCCRGHLDALGMRIRRDRIEPLPEAWRRLRGLVGNHVRGVGRRRDAEGLARSIAAAMGHRMFG